MAKPNLPSPELLRQLLSYESATGRLTWKEREPDYFFGKTLTPKKRSQKWNARMAGCFADTGIQTKGYRSVVVQNRMFLAHRVVWAIKYSEWPSCDIDHINGDRQDNRISNLRMVDKCLNMRYVGRQTKPSPTGVVGVFRTKSGNWGARICGRQIGTFPSFEEAVAARKAEAKRLGFTDRHGCG